MEAFLRLLVVESMGPFKVANNHDICAAQVPREDDGATSRVTRRFAVLPFGKFLKAVFVGGNLYCPCFPSNQKSQPPPLASHRVLIRLVPSGRTVGASLTSRRCCFADLSASLTDACSETCRREVSTMDRDGEKSQLYLPYLDASSRHVQFSCEF